MLYVFYVVIHTQRENKIMSCECWRDIEYFWEGTVFGASEYCPPIIKLSRLISLKAFRAFYNGGHYSLRGDIIH